MKTMFQGGLNGRVPVPSEKRFLIHAFSASALTRTQDGAWESDFLPDDPDCTEDFGFVEQPWTGQWIWTAASKDAPVPYSHYDYRNNDIRVRAAWFRRRFEVDEELCGPIFLRITADSLYRVWMNGRLIARGPAPVGGSYAFKGSPDWYYEDAVEVIDLLNRPGPHLIAIEVISGPEDPTRFSRGVGGLRCEIIDGEGRVLLCSDESWQAMDAAAYPPPAPGWMRSITRTCDLRQWPTGWHTDRLNDLNWPKAVQIADAGWNLRTHQVPQLAEGVERPVEVVIPFIEHRERCKNADALRSGTGTMSITAGPTWLGMLRFDGLFSGHIQVIAKGHPGTRIEIAAEEVPGQDEGAFRQQILTLGEDPVVFESVGTFSARILRMTVKIPEGGRPLELSRVSLLVQTQPVKLRGSFACSDEKLTQLWSACRRNLHLCLQQIHLDSPHHQEPLGDQGDYLVEARMAYNAFGPYPLITQDLLRMAEDLRYNDGTTFHHAYALLMPDLALDYLRATSDAATVLKILPVIDRVLERTLSWKGPEGLISQAPNYMFIDWVEHRGANYHHPPAAQGMGAMTSFLVRALIVQAELRRRLNDTPAKMLEHIAEADRLAQAFRTNLIDPETGTVWDGRSGWSKVELSRWLPADGPDKVVTRHGAILAVWAGILNLEAGRRALGQVLDDPTLPEPQPYFQHFLFDSLQKVGWFAERGRKQLDLWQAMLAEHPHTLREMWTHGDYSHAWCGTPLVQCSERILGVEVLSANPPRVHLSPQPLNLTWAQGTVPVGRVDLSVRWERRNGEIFLTWGSSGPIEVSIDPSVRKG
ncbi:MAG: hypothetical protein WCI20_09425 [bacterium]